MSLNQFGNVSYQMASLVSSWRPQKWESHSCFVFGLGAGSSKAWFESGRCCWEFLLEAANRLNVFWTIHCESGESASSVAVISTTALNVGWDDFLRLVMLSNPSSALLVSPAGEAHCWWTMVSPSSPLCCSPSAKRPNRTRCSSSAVS